MDDLLQEFLAETAEGLDLVDRDLIRLEQEPANRTLVDQIFRVLHTIKGTCGFLGLVRLQTLAHAAETLLDDIRAGQAPVDTATISAVLASVDGIKNILHALRADGREPPGTDEDLIARLVNASKPQGSAVPSAGAPEPARRAGWKADERTDLVQGIRVNIDVIDHLMTLVHELVLTRNQLMDMAARAEETTFKVPLQRLSTITTDLQDGVTRTRMQPIGLAFRALPRFLRDLGTELGKKFELELEGEEVELDRQIIELIKDPIAHIVRNAADHGIETPQERRAAGKPEAGRIRISALHEGGHIVVSVRDDGRGLDISRIKNAALKQGLASERALAEMTDAQVYQLIFSPGFSTASRVTNLSGRGVGLDVVRANIQQIGGTIDLQAVAGRGTVFTFKIPLTLAIVSVLIVGAAGERFALPQLNVVEIVKPGRHAGATIDCVNRAPVLKMRGRILPLVYLSELLTLENPEQRQARQRDDLIVIAEVGSFDFGIVVDQAFDTAEIVVKPKAKILNSVSVFSGTTILGDGTPVMIIDPGSIAASIGIAESSTERPHGFKASDAALTTERTLFLVFKAGRIERRAIPLGLVTRLEEIDAKAIETVGGRPVLQYRGRLMPLVGVSPDDVPRQAGLQRLIVLGEEQALLGLMIDEVIDIVDQPLAALSPSTEPGIVGTAVIQGKATGIVDVAYYLASIPALERSLGTDHDKPRVLLVEPNAFYRNMIAPILSFGGYAVTAVDSSAAVLALKDAGACFDLVVADRVRLGLEGVHLQEILDTDPAWRTLPRLDLAADDTAASGAAGDEMGVLSTFDRTRLMRAVEARLRNRERAA